MTSSIAARASTTATPRVTPTMVWALGVLGSAVCVLSVVFVVQGSEREWAAQRGIVELAIIGMPLAAGLYALRAPHNERFGFALIVASFAWSLTALGESASSLPYSIGRVSAWLVF